MLKKLSLNKTQVYEKCIAIEQIANMLKFYIKGVPCSQEIGAEQGDISVWDDFVIKNCDSSTTYIQVKRQTTSFGTTNDKVVRNKLENGKSSGQWRQLSPFDHVFKSLAEVTIDDKHINDSFWICLPEDNAVSIKHELTVRDFRNVWEDIKKVTQGIDLQKLACVNSKTQNVVSWLQTWCDFKDWNHIVRALKLLEIKTFGYENDIKERTEDILKVIFNSKEIDTVYDHLYYYIDSNSTYAGAIRPRELLCELRKYLRPEVERWTMFNTDGYSWTISGINDLEQNYIEGKSIIERIPQIAESFWGKEHTCRRELKILGKYSKECEITKCLMRLSMHLEGAKSTSSTQRDLWISDIKSAVGGTLGNGEDDFENIYVSQLNDTFSEIFDSQKLKKLCEKEKYAEKLNNELHLVVLKKIQKKIQDKIKKINPGVLRDRLEECWEYWYEKLESDDMLRKNFLIDIVYPECEGKSILGELRVGCKTVALIGEAVFLTMVVSVALSDNGEYNWSCLNTALRMRTIGLKYWTGSAESCKEVIEISDNGEIAKLLSKEKEEVIILSGTNESVSNLLETDMSDNYLSNGLLSDRKQPQLLVSYDYKLKGLIKKGEIKEIKDYLQWQLDKYKNMTNKAIERIID